MNKAIKNNTRSQFLSEKVNKIETSTSIASKIKLVMIFFSFKIFFISYFSMVNHNMRMYRVKEELSIKTSWWSPLCRSLAYYLVEQDLIGSPSTWRIYNPTATAAVQLDTFDRRFLIIARVIFEYVVRHLLGRLVKNI